MHTSSVMSWGWIPKKQTWLRSLRCWGAYRFHFVVGNVLGSKSYNPLILFLWRSTGLGCHAQFFFHLWKCFFFVTMVFSGDRFFHPEFFSGDRIPIQNVHHASNEVSMQCSYVTWTFRKQILPWSKLMSRPCIPGAMLVFFGGDVCGRWIVAWPFFWTWF